MAAGTGLSLWATVDVTPPTTTISGCTHEGIYPDGWFALSASDDSGGSGVSGTYYTLDGGVPTPYPGSSGVTLGCVGPHTVTYWSADTAGNVEAAHVATFFVTGPALFTMCTGPYPGWSNVAPELTLEPIGYQFPITSYYRVNGGAETTYTGPITIDLPGTTQLTYWSVDALGLVEPPNETTVQYDPVPPVSAIGITEGAECSPGDWIPLTATDVFSGVAGTYYYIDDSNVEQSCGLSKLPVPVTPGTHSIRYYSIDQAGNIEALNVVTFTVLEVVSNDPPRTGIDLKPVYEGPAVFHFYRTDSVAVTYYSVDGAADIEVPRGSLTPTVTVTGPGQHDLRFYSVDQEGRVEQVNTLTFRIEDTPPVTSSDAVATYVGTASIHLSAVDDTSGTITTHYRLDDGPDNVGSTVVVTTPGTHSLIFYSVDGAGNVEWRHVVTFELLRAPDETPPTTSSDVRTSYVGTATIHLVADDDAAGWGVAETRFTLDAGPEAIGTIVTASEPGTHTLCFHSVDHAGNVESATVVAFVITAEPEVDSVAPSTTSDVKASYLSSATIHLTATDDPGGSGVAHTYCRLDGGAALETSTIFVSTPGTHTLECWSVDAAGNLEQREISQFTVTAVPVRTSVSIKTNVTTCYIGRTATLSGILTPTGLVGRIMVVFVEKPGSARWSCSSNRGIYLLSGKAAWLYKYVFRRGMTKGPYRFKAVVQASAGFVGCTSPTTVSVRLR